MWVAGVHTDAPPELPHSCSSAEQAEVEAECSALFSLFYSEEGTLERTRVVLGTSAHLAYLRDGVCTLGPGYASLDASRPWIAYWIVHSMVILGSPPGEALAAAIVNFLGRCIDPESGGFCGGPHPGQSAHLAPTYAAVNTLVSLGTPEAYATVQRANLRSFLLRMKRADGAFTMHDDGEVDVRGAYCALSVAALTGELDEHLAAGTAEWLLGCQTYEGGIGATPGEEAHGGYTFCGLAALVLLSEAHKLRLQSLVAWLCQRQMAHSGGFQGRTNKLVDSCYSFWQGGAFPLVQTVLCSLGQLAADVDLYHAPGLLDYILVCAQTPHGGLRDKPGKGRDYYHTCYSLSGLAIAASAHSLEGVPREWIEGVRLVNPVFNVVNEQVETALRHFGQRNTAKA